MNLTYMVNTNYTNVKEVLKNHFKVSDRLLTRLKKNSAISLNGKSCNIYDPISMNDIIKIDFNYDEDNSNIVSTKMDLDIIYEDDGLLIVNKPPFLAVHPSMLHYSGSLSNGVRFYFDSIGLKKKIRPVNRLDKNTSGIVIFAKNEYIQESLIRQMENGVFTKEYLAIVVGDMSSLKKRNN